MKQVTLICLLSVLLCSCEKPDMKGDIQSENDIRFNSVQKVIVTRDNGLLIAGVCDSKLTFIKILEPDGDESMSEEFSFSEINFNETGNDLIELKDDGFIIAGRSRSHDEPWDMDCGITRLNSSGKKIWTKTFGTGSDEWLEGIIFHSGKEFIVQGSIGYPGADVQKTILIKIDQDGAISDSLTTDRIEPLVYHPHEYFIKYQNEEDDCVHFEKIPVSKLFK